MLFHYFTPRQPVEIEDATAHQTAMPSATFRPKRCTRAAYTDHATTPSALHLPPALRQAATFTIKAPARLKSRAAYKRRGRARSRCRQIAAFADASAKTAIDYVCSEIATSATIDVARLCIAAAHASIFRLYAPTQRSMLAIVSATYYADAHRRRRWRDAVPSRRDSQH
jgi:hypothetical protein